MRSLKHSSLHRTPMSLPERPSMRKLMRPPWIWENCFPSMKMLWPMLSASTETHSLPDLTEAPWTSATWTCPDLICPISISICRMQRILPRLLRNCPVSRRMHLMRRFHRWIFRSRRKISRICIRNCGTVFLPIVRKIRILLPDPLPRMCSPGHLRHRSAPGSTNCST